MTDCVVPDCKHDDNACVTEAESHMSFEQFIDKVAAEEGLPQKDADRYKRAFATAVGIPTSMDSGRES